MRVLRRSLLAAALLAAAWFALAIPASAQDPEVPPAPEAVLQVTDVLAGIGDAALPGMIVIVHYTGWLYDPSARDGRGKQFDSSRDRRQPFSFPLGAGRVIQGWDKGVPGMRVGGIRRLQIPPELGYGQRSVGNGLIPPDSTLLFEIELLAVETVTLTPQAQ